MRVGFVLGLCGVVFCVLSSFYHDYIFFIMTLKKGHNPTKGDNPDLKKYGSAIFFYEESFCEISKPYLKFGMFFDIPSFLCQNLQRAITQKK